MKTLTATQRTKEAIASEKHTAFITYRMDHESEVLQAIRAAGMEYTTGWGFRNAPERVGVRCEGESGREVLRAAVKEIKTATLLKTAWW